MTGLDVASLRAGTPGCEERAHLANAGAALSPRSVHDAVAAHRDLEIHLGGYEAQAAAAHRFADGRAALATLLGARADQVALAESATLAWWRVLGALGLRPGDSVAVTGMDYLSIVLPLVQAGLDIRVLPDVDVAGVTVDTTAPLLRGVRAVVAAHAASHVGCVQDVAALGALLREVEPNAWYVVDAAQSVGQVPVDLPSLQCDALVATGRKWLRAPRGTAFLVAGDRLVERTPVPLDSNTGGLDGDRVVPVPGVARFEPFELSWASHAGLGAAAEFLLAVGPEAVYERIAALASRLRAAMADTPGVTVTDRGTAPGGIVTFRHRDVPAAELVSRLGGAGITVGAARSAVAPYDRQSPDAVVRVSPHAYNTEGEVDRVVDIVAAL